MSSLSQLYKHRNNWTRADLGTHNIRVTARDIASFFGIHSLPEAQVPAEILDVQEAVDMANDDNAMLINLLDAAMVPPFGNTSSEDSAVIDFTVQLFRYLGGYVGRRRYTRTRRHLPLPMRHHTKDAEIDLCIVDSSNNHIVLLVQPDHGCISDAEAKLVANAIAAFVYNNECRKASGLPELQSKVSLFSVCYFARLLTAPIGDGRDCYVWNYADVL
jgi:predicted transcriptional regulator